MAVGGVAFAVFLMFTELGFLTALLDSAVALIERLRGDLYLISPAKLALVVPERFPYQRLLQARTCGVSSYPLYMECAYGIVRQPGKRGYPIRVLGFDLQEIPFESSDLQAVAAKLQAPFTAAYDTASKAHYGFPGPGMPPEATLELSGQPLHLRGRFRLCTDFATEGTLIVSTSNFLRYFPFRAGPTGNLPEQVDIGVLRVPNGADVRTIQECLRRTLPQDVLVLTKDEFIWRERKFWLSNTPIGYIFVVGTIIGFVVGVIICYQVIFADLDDHIREFATLAAIGYSHTYFVSVVICQSLYLSILGYLPALVLTYATYRTLENITGLVFALRWELALAVFVGAVSMCILSGILALRRLRRADPASLF